MKNSVIYQTMKEMCFEIYDTLKYFFLLVILIVAVTVLTNYMTQMKESTVINFVDFPSPESEKAQDIKLICHRPESK